MIILLRSIFLKIFVWKYDENYNIQNFMEIKYDANYDIKIEI